MVPTVSPKQHREEGGHHKSQFKQDNNIWLQHHGHWPGVVVYTDSAGDAGLSEELGGWPKNKNLVIV